MKLWRSKLVCALLATVTATLADAQPLRVCADPSNMPFSDRNGAGFENRIALLLGKQLHREIEFVWRPERRNFLRNGLMAGACDLVTGAPADIGGVATTRPYYRSGYVFVSRPDDPPVSSFDDPSLPKRKIGVQMIGDDGMSTPPAEELVRRGNVSNLRSYMASGDYREPDSSGVILKAVARGDIDLAAVWGPVAGYFAAREKPALVVTPIASGGASLPLAFDISIGVRKQDATLLDDVQQALDRSRPEIDCILAQFHVPDLRADAGSTQGCAEAR
jgi:mxaJ protein